MAYTVRVVKYEPWTGDPSSLVSMAEARKITGMTLPGVIAAVLRGELTEIINDQAKFHGRRCLLRSEVEHYNADKKSA